MKTRINFVVKIFSHYFIYYVGKSKEKNNIIGVMVDIYKNIYAIYVYN